MFLACLAFFAKVRSKPIPRFKKLPSGEEVRSSRNEVQERMLNRLLKFFVMAVASLGFMIWVSDALSGADSVITSTMKEFVAGGALIICVWLYMMLGGARFKDAIKNTRGYKALMDVSRKPAFQALVIIVFGLF